MSWVSVGTVVFWSRSVWLTSLHGNSNTIQTSLGTIEALIGIHNESSLSTEMYLLRTEYMMYNYSEHHKIYPSIMERPCSVPPPIQLHPMWQYTVQETNYETPPMLMLFC